jgi:hypothetical protein
MANCRYEQANRDNSSFISLTKGRPFGAKFSH